MSATSSENVLDFICNLNALKGGMLGISKESWMAALEKENYLKAAEMSMEDD